jgi:hypothetical protein
MKVRYTDTALGEKWEHEEENGEDDQGAAVDDGRCPHVEDACARENKNDGDCTETEAERGSDVSASNATWGNAGWRSEEEKDEIGSDVRVACGRIVCSMISP